jgi:hypothetical protein
MVVVLHSTGGHFIGHEPYLDPVMHFLGGVAVAFFVLRLSATTAFLARLEPIGRGLLAFGSVCAAALVWEAGEFASDQLLRPMCNSAWPTRCEIWFSVPSVVSHAS